MNKIQLLTIGVVLLFLLNAGTIIYLFKGKPHPGERAQRPDAFIIEQLQLDKEQQQSFALLREQHQSIIRPAKEEDRRLHDLYFSLLKTDQPDKAKVDSVTILLAEQRRIIETATFDHFHQLRNLCRPDQKKLFDATIDDIARRMAPPPPPR